MIISCKCLNVTIGTETPELQDVNVQILELGGFDQMDPFFNHEKIGTVELVRISIEQECLVQVRDVGSWIINRCMNCSLNTHAIHRERGAACVLVSRALLTNPSDIAALKISDKYSTVFRIVIDQKTSDLSTVQAPGKLTVPQLEGPEQAAIQQQLCEAIEQEVARVDEKVRVYSEQQYAALEEFRENAHRDHRALIRLVCEAKGGVSIAAKPLSIESSKQSPTVVPPLHLSTSVPQLPFTVMSSIPLNPVPILGNVASSPSRRQQSTGEPFSANKIQKTNGSTPMSIDVIGSNKTERRVKSKLFSQLSSTNKTEGSLDTEGLFDLEGMEDLATEVFQSDHSDQSDTDDSGSHDEGIHIPRSRSAQYNLAKSLPMKVPEFLSANRRAGDEQEDERKRPQDPMDIAASIKALARSVHGDANVFGELPRPRFSTQI